jgi:hypothetical protein
MSARQCDGLAAQRRRCAAGAAQRPADRRTPAGRRRRKPKLACWQVTGLSMDPLPAMMFLSRLRQHAPHAFVAGGAERLRIGNDLYYWSNAAKFALEVLIGQHYVPTLRMADETALYALWQPMLLDDRMQRRFERSSRPCRPSAAPTISSRPQTPNPRSN